MGFIEKMITKIRQHFCKHKYVKHWMKGTGYNIRCIKCGKVKEYGSN